MNLYQWEIGEIAVVIRRYIQRNLSQYEYTMIGKLVKEYGYERVEEILPSLAQLKNTKAPLHYLYKILKTQERKERGKEVKEDIKDLMKDIGKWR